MARLELPQPDALRPPADSALLNQKRFNINMAVFKNLFPDVHARLEKIEHPHSRLVAQGDDDFDIEFAGTLLYGGGARRATKRRVDTFFRTPEDKIRLSLSPPDSRNMDSHSNLALYRTMKRAVDDVGASFSTFNHSRQCFHLLVMGIGLAEHLPLLFKETRCRHLFLVEPNAEFLYWSMFTFDWKKFLSQFLSEDRLLSFNLPDSGNVKTAATFIRDQVRSINPSFVDGSYLYLAYPSSFLEAILRDIAENKAFLITGLGFLEDEIDMVRNSYRNLVDFSGRYYLKQDTIQTIPAFVVAAGPSLDNDLKFIKENVGRAIVISCGTTLRILLHNGIRPDFHMEMENVPAVYDLMSKLSQSHSLEGITLVASSTIDPRVKTLFDDVVFYFRAGLASYPMFNLGRESGIPSGVPTVANLGLSFAQNIGCRTIYLFGVDLGTRDTSRHHAKDAAYNAGEIEFKTTIDQPFPGNFGGTVLSEFIYLWSRDLAQAVIHAHATRIIHYNCSDGVRIDGAIPKLSRTITLMAPPQDKRPIVNSIATRMPEYTRNSFDAAWTNKKCIQDTLQLRDVLLAHCEDKATYSTAKNRFPLAYMARTVRVLIPRKTPDTAEIHYFRGSIFTTMIAFHYYASRVADPTKRRAVLRIMREEFMRFVNEIAEHVIAFYRELDPKKIAREEKGAAGLLSRTKKKKKKAKTAPAAKAKRASRGGGAQNRRKAKSPPPRKMARRKVARRKVARPRIKAPGRTGRSR